MKAETRLQAGWMMPTTCVKSLWKEENPRGYVCEELSKVVNPSMLNGSPDKTKHNKMKKMRRRKEEEKENEEKQIRIMWENQFIHYQIPGF